MHQHWYWQTSKSVLHPKLNQMLFVLWVNCLLWHPLRSYPPVSVSQCVAHAAIPRPASVVQQHSSDHWWRCAATPHGSGDWCHPPHPGLPVGSQPPRPPQPQRQHQCVRGMAHNTQLKWFCEDLQLNTVVPWPSAVPFEEGKAPQTGLRNVQHVWFGP